MRRVVALLSLGLISACATAQRFSCSCGAQPPGPPPVRNVSPYAGEPDDLRPFSKFTTPYWNHYLETNVYLGAARDVPEPHGLKEIRIGFLGPLQGHPEFAFGQRMLHGAQLAVEEANAGGGYGGVPFKLVVRNDYDNWQVASAASEGDAKESSIWGSASNDVVKMVYDDEVWAIFGSISSESTHIALRMALRAEVPIVNSASTDPTIPETTIPWYFTNLQDDRVQNLTLARRIYSELGLKRIAILRVNSRYGRFGVAKFRDASRRLGHPVVIEQKFVPGETDFRIQLGKIRDSQVDGMVLWTDQKPAAAILKQMRELGMSQKVFGGYRILGEELIKEAGDAAEGVEAVFPYDPSRDDPRWTAFERRYEAKFGEAPDQFAAPAYDAMQILLKAICSAGLNRARIHDALAQVYEYNGVTGPMVFDPNAKNVAPMYLGLVHGGKISYRPATMEKAQAPSATSSSVRRIESQAAGSTGAPAVPYARPGEEGVGYYGPAQHSAQQRDVSLVLFGRNAESVAASAELHMLARAWSKERGAALTLIPVASGASWGKSANALVDAIYHRGALGIVALDRDSAHFAEQLSLKSFLPVIALADDRTLTSTNVPWIFRLPAETMPSRAVDCFLDAIRQGARDRAGLRSALASGVAFAGVRFQTNGEQVTTPRQPASAPR